jgi:hypothetical protein
MENDMMNGGTKLLTSSRSTWRQRRSTIDLTDIGMRSCAKPQN